MANLSEEKSPLARRPARLVTPPALHHNPPRWTWRVTIPANYYNLWILLEGDIGFEVAGRTFHADRPTTFLLRPGEAVFARNRRSAPVLNFALHIDRRSLDAGAVAARIDGLRGLPLRDPDTIRSWIQAAVGAANRPEPACREIAACLAEAILLHCWLEASEPGKDSRRERLLRIAEEIRQRPGKEWRVGDLAARAGISRSLFSREFTRHCGTGPREWITRCRIDRATQFLRESTMNISQIADALGYRDVYFFSRHFRTRTGTSPSRYRRDHR